MVEKRKATHGVLYLFFPFFLFGCTWKQPSQAGAIIPGKSVWLKGVASGESNMVGSRGSGKDCGA